MRDITDNQISKIATFYSEFKYNNAKPLTKDQENKKIADFVKNILDCNEDSKFKYHEKVLTFREIYGKIGISQARNVVLTREKSKDGYICLRNQNNFIFPLAIHL